MASPSTTTKALPTDPTKFPVMTRQLLIDIFLGNILNWNDPRIAAAQSVLAPGGVGVGYIFPNKPIKIVYRTDSSGTITTFLTAMAFFNQSAMQSAGLYTSSGIPSSTDLNNPSSTSAWPFLKASSPNFGRGLPSTGNDQVTFRIALNDGAFGPVSYPFMASGSPYFQMVNANGDVTLPTAAAIQTALAYGVAQGSLTSANAPTYSGLSSTTVSASSPLGNLLFTIDAKSANAWPIAEFNFLMIPDIVNADCYKALEISQFLLWGLQSQVSASAQVFLNYVPIVGAMQKTLMNTIVNTHCGTDGSSLVFDTIFPYERAIAGVGIACAVLSFALGFVVFWKRQHPAIKSNGLWILLGVSLGSSINYFTLYLWIGFPVPFCVFKQCFVVCTLSLSLSLDGIL
jgi:ABC-type phosphate transport system substrate-binding protein